MRVVRLAGVVLNEPLFRCFNFDFVRVDQLSGKSQLINPVSGEGAGFFDFFQEFPLCRERPFSFNKPI